MFYVWYEYKTVLLFVLCGFIFSFLAKRLLLIAFFSPWGDYPEYVPLCVATTFFS